MKNMVAASLAIICLSGCTAKWIEEPSPSTTALVNDMVLDGYECNASSSSIVCRQAKPTRTKLNAVCSAKDGCVERGYVLTFNEYTIREGQGVPRVDHRVVELKE